MGEGVTTLLDSALDMASRGYRVFPLLPAAKVPAAHGWQQMATTDETRIRQWWGAEPVCIGFTKDGREVLSNPNFNPGILTGDGLLVIDVDVKNGHQGVASAKAMGVKAEGFVVETPSEGLHIYTDGPDVQNVGDGKLGDGLDIRSVGGYVVGPGAIVGGKPYKIVRDGERIPVLPAIVHACTAVSEKRGSEAPVVTPDTPLAVDLAIAYLTERAPLAVEGQGGDHTTFVVASEVKDYGVSEDMAADLMAEHWNDRCSPPWDIDDLKTKIRNAYEYGARPIGDKHPMADFQGVKVPPVEPVVEKTPGRAWFRHGDARGRIDWLFYQLLPKVATGVLLAESQAGKTFLAIHLAKCLATGDAFFGVKPDDLGGTLFLFAGSEGSGLSLRLDALQQDGKLPISATIVGNLADRDAWPKMLADCREEAARIDMIFGVPVRLIVIETLAASGLLNDENDNSEASRAMANLATFAREMGALVVTSHHPDKAGKGSRGASAIPANADYVLEIDRDRGSDIRELALTKGRDAEQRKLGTFTLLDVDLGRDERGRKITSKTVSTGDVMSPQVRQAAHFDRFMAALEYCLMDDGEELPDGRRGAELSLVKAQFAELKGGSRDRSNIKKTFDACVAWGQSIARVDVVGHGTEKFIVLREPMAVAA